MVYNNATLGYIPNVLTFGIRTRMLLLLMVATTIPLWALNFFWTTTARQRLRQTAQQHQALIAEKSASNVDAFLNEKIRALIVHSQSNSMQQLNATQAKTELEALMYQDKDLERVSLANKSGRELVALDNQLHSLPLRDIANYNEFKVVNFLAGKEYLSPVTINSRGDPTVNLAVPLIAFTKPQDLNTISTAEPGVIRNASDIKGVLLVTINLGDLWQSVLAHVENTSTSSYAYVVDDKGTIIAHPDNRLLRQQHDASQVPIVAKFMKQIDNNVTAGTLEGNSEKNTPVLAAYHIIPTAKWALVFQESQTSIYASVTQISQLGFVLAGVGVLIVALVSYALSRYITTPILKLAAAADKIGKGDLDTAVDVKRSDEIGALGKRITAMAQSLKRHILHLQTERNQLQVILNSSTEGIIAINQAGTIVIANKAVGQLTKKANSLIVGQSIEQVLPWTLANKRPFKIDYRQPGIQSHKGLEYVSPDGITHYLDLSVAHVQASPESVTAIITIHDQTKSRDLDNMKVDFVSMAAHELRTPVTAIRGYLELIMYKFAQSLPEQLSGYIHQTHKSALELNGLVNNLLSISRIERGHLTLSLEKVDLAETLGHTKQNLQLSAREKDIRLIFEGQASDCFVWADPIAVQEVVNNLLSNAIKYTPPGGQVNIQLKRDGSTWLTTISDTGVGIPANALPNLFTKFYRVQGGLASDNTGTGIGLFISKSIIERHGGKIWVQSKVGEGSTFAFTLPAFSPEQQRALINSQPQNIRRQRGWITKNITR